jgi:hypothetical protein
MGKLNITIHRRLARPDFRDSVNTAHHSVGARARLLGNHGSNPGSTGVPEQEVSVCRAGGFDLRDGYTLDGSFKPPEHPGGHPQVLHYEFLPNYVGVDR